MTDQNLSRTKRSSQAIDNFSFDEDFLVKVVELVKRNQAGTAIEYFNPATEEKQDTLIAQTLGDKPLSGASANGTVDLTSANTWYAVPSGTPPATPYVLVTSLENAAGTVRFGFANTSTPSVTNGNLADGTITLRLAGGQVVYFGSSTAGDDVNFSTKII